MKKNTSMRAGMATGSSAIGACVLLIGILFFMQDIISKIISIVALVIFAISESLVAKWNRRAGYQQGLGNPVPIKDLADRDEYEYFLNRIVRPEDATMLLLRRAADPWVYASYDPQAHAHLIEELEKLPSTHTYFQIVTGEDGRITIHRPNT